VICLGTTDRIRESRIVLGKASGTISYQFGKLERKISEFMKDQSIQILDKEWIIRQSEDTFAVIHLSGDQQSYSIKKREKILVCGADGAEQSRYDLAQIEDVQIEVNPDKSDDVNDRIILVMKNGKKEPISNYEYLFNKNPVVVRALRYGLELQSWLYFSPDM
jgi:hypothetical protein